MVQDTIYAVMWEQCFGMRRISSISDILLKKKQPKYVPVETLASVPNRLKLESPSIVSAGILLHFIKYFSICKYE